MFDKLLLHIVFQLEDMDGDLGKSRRILNSMARRWVEVHAYYSAYLPTVPILNQEKGRKKSDFIMCSYFCKNLPVVMYRKLRNVPIFKDIPPICPYFLGFRVGKYDSVLLHWQCSTDTALNSIKMWLILPRH